MPEDLEEHIALPARGRIVGFEEVDGVGTIQLDDGGRVRFGLDSLRGVEVDHEGAIVVHELRRHRVLGLCALDVRDAAFAALSLAQQKQAILGRIGTSEEPRGHIGWIAVAFPDTPPMTDAEWSGVAEGFGPVDLEWELTEGDGAMSGTLSVGPHRMLVEVVMAPLDTRGLNRAHVEQPHRSFVAITPQVISPSARRLQRGEHFQDPWGEAGYARLATALVRALLGAGGTFVHLALAQSLKPAEVFVHEAREPHDLEERGWLAWLDAGRLEGGQFSTFGMAAFGLCDVEVIPAEGVDFNELVDIGFAACEARVRENRELSLGDSFERESSRNPGRSWAVQVVGADEVIRLQPG